MVVQMAWRAGLFASSISVLEEKERAGAVGGQDFVGGCADANGVMLTEAIFARRDFRNDWRSRRFGGLPEQSQRETCQSSAEEVAAFQVGETNHHLSLCAGIESECAWILTQLECGRGIMKVAGEPGDRWLRLRSGGVKPPLQGRSGRKVRTPL